MAVALGSALLLAQLAGLVGSGFLIYDLIGLPGVLFPAADVTFGELLPFVRDTVVSYWAVFLLSAVGATGAALLMLKDYLRTGWYLGACRVAGWLWVPMLPLGPVLGIILLRARSHALRRDGD